MQTQRIDGSTQTAVSGAGTTVEEAIVDLQRRIMDLERALIPDRRDAIYSSDAVEACARNLEDAGSTEPDTETNTMRLRRRIENVFSCLIEVDRALVASRRATEVRLQDLERVAVRDMLDAIPLGHGGPRQLAEERIHARVMARE